MIDAEKFLGESERLARAGFRLVLINATGLPPAAGQDEGDVDLVWTFEQGGKLEHLRERVEHGARVPSLSALFGPAFLYENEIRELFGVNVTGIDVDLKGQLYKTSQRVPFAPSAIRARLEATGRLEPKPVHSPAPAPEAGA